MKMVYCVEQDTFIVVSYYRNGTIVKEECAFCNLSKQEYLTKYPDFQIQETSLEAHIRGDVINIFARNGNLNKGESSPFTI